MDFDGSDMLRGAVLDDPISDVDDTFAMKMHRLEDDYLMESMSHNSVEVEASI